MKRKENAHFEKMQRIQTAYVDYIRSLDAEKHIIIEEHGWGSPEMDAWIEARETAKNAGAPYSTGALKALRAWRTSIEKGNSEIEMDDFLWDHEVEDFLDTMRIAQIETFIYTNQSTSLMDNFHDLVQHGAKMAGLAVITREETKLGKTGLQEIRGVRFNI